VPDASAAAIRAIPYVAQSPASTAARHGPADRPQSRSTSASART
jgi:hypothetical protein